MLCSVSMSNYISVKYLLKYAFYQLNECRFNRNSTAVKLSGFRDVAQGSEAALKAAIAGNGPVSIAIDAGHPSFQVGHAF